MKSYKLTEKNFKLFEKRCKFFVDKFGLINWELHILKQSECNDEDEGTSRAWTTASTGDKLAMIVINDEWDVEYSDYWLSRIAFHECLELLFWTIFEKLKKDKRKDEIIHNIIRVFEMNVFPYFFKEIQLLNKKK